MKTVSKTRLLLMTIVSLALLLVACSTNSGLPKEAGNYDVRAKSVSYDGREYSFHWVDKDASVHPAKAENIKMVQDERTYLETGDSDPVLHLSAEDPVTVRGEDSRGAFDTFWFPFLLGRMAGGGPVINQPYGGAPETLKNVPTYHYPPAGDFGRDDTLSGSVTNSKPSAPDYSRVAPAPNAVSGQGGGTGAGTASTQKSGAASGQSGGTGSGSAASEKGGFRSGSSSFSSKSSASPPKVGAGSGKSAGSGSSSGSRAGGAKAGGGGRGGGK